MQKDALIEYRDSEIGFLPRDWEIVRLGDFAEKITKGSSPNWQGFDYVDDGVNFVRSQNVGWGSLELADIAKVPERFNLKESKSIIKCNDVLINIVGASIGRVALADERISGGNLNQAVALVRLKQDFEPHFLVCFLLTEKGQEQFHQHKKEIARANLSLQDIANLFIPLPSLPEQRRIAAILDAIQEAIAAQEDVIAAARAFKRSLMQRLLTYGPGREPAVTQETLYGEVPISWELCALSDCAYVQTGIAKGRRYEPGTKLIEVPYLRVANVQDGYLDLSEMKTIAVTCHELERHRVEIGDVLMTEGGDFDKLGRGFIWKGEVENCIHQNHVFAVRANPNILTPEYLTYLSQSSYGKAYFLTVAHRTTNLASINTIKLKALPVLIPPKHEQEQIVDMLQAADAKIAAEEDRKAALQAFFQSTLHQLMTGQVRLLSDEGLSTLLELPQM